jgi:hypothetical protein
MTQAIGEGTRLCRWTRIGWLLLLSVPLLAVGIVPAAAAPKAEPWSFWAANDSAGKVRVDHAPWDRFLKHYVVINHPSGINRVRYASVTADDRKALDDYIERLQGVEVTRLWKDNRVHYAVNCASLGCPNLQPEAYTAENTETLLEKGAREYVSHPRGARLEAERLHLSSIYDWFRSDFEGSEEGVRRHVSRYASPSLASRLKDFRGKVSYDYDWRINEP